MSRCISLLDKRQFPSDLSAARRCCRILCQPSQILLSGVWVDDPLDSEEDSIVFDIHYFQDIMNVVKDAKVAPVFNEKYDRDVEPLKSKADQIPILDGKTVASDSDNTTISIHEWEKMRESDL